MIPGTQLKSDAEHANGQYIFLIPFTEEKEKNSAAEFVVLDDWILKKNEKV